MKCQSIALLLVAACLSTSAVAQDGCQNNVIDGAGMTRTVVEDAALQMAVVYGTRHPGVPHGADCVVDITATPPGNQFVAIGHFEGVIEQPRDAGRTVKIVREMAVQTRLSSAELTIYAQRMRFLNQDNGVVTLAPELLVRVIGDERKRPLYPSRSGRVVVEWVEYLTPTEQPRVTTLASVPYVDGQPIACAGIQAEICLRTTWQRGKLAVRLYSARVGTKATVEVPEKYDSYPDLRLGYLGGRANGETRDAGVTVRHRLCEFSGLNIPAHVCNQEFSW